jgi:hypothetical protein
MTKCTRTNRLQNRLEEQLREQRCREEAFFRRLFVWIEGRLKEVDNSSNYGYIISQNGAEAI